MLANSLVFAVVPQKCPCNICNSSWSHLWHTHSDTYKYISIQNLPHTHSHIHASICSRGFSLLFILFAILLLLLLSLLFFFFCLSTCIPLWQLPAVPLTLASVRCAQFCGSLPAIEMLLCKLFQQIST